MTCKCGHSGVYNEVNGKGFYYCRNCKVEIELEEPPTVDEDEISWSSIAHNYKGLSYWSIDFRD